jgi:hypothetical protein
MDTSRREALQKEYSEVLSNFRLLTDIRFKLLGLLPIATAAAAAVKFEKGSSPVPLPLALFGLVATIGLVTYNTRNDQLYDELVSRAASIERSLGLPDGAFANRPRAWYAIKSPVGRWRVDHRPGVGTVYAASIALWLFAVLSALVEFIRCFYVGLGLPPFRVADPSLWVNVTAFFLAIAITCLGITVITKQRENRKEEMENLAASAVELALPIKLAKAAKDPDFIEYCAKLADNSYNATEARARFYAELDAESLCHYLPHGSKEISTCHFVALLTDLSPRQIFDWATKRVARDRSSCSRPVSIR